MTQRNPMNERYQNTGEKKAGKTRKSAASAKPTSKAASSVYIEGAKTAKPQGRMAKAQRRAQASQNERDRQKSKANDNYFQPNSEEYRKWRRVWWVMIVAALVLTSLSFVVSGRVESRVPVYALLSAGYLALVVAIVVDVQKVRKIRKQEAAAYSTKSKASKKERKAQEARRAAEEQAAKEAAEAKKAEKAAKKSRGLFGGKKRQESEGEEA